MVTPWLALLALASWSEPWEARLLEDPQSGETVVLPVAQPDSAEIRLASDAQPAPVVKRIAVAPDNVLWVEAAQEVEVTQAGKPPAPQNYIGVTVEAVPEVLAMHFGELLSKGQGLVITRVTPDSPAAKAELKEHDIVSHYDDQKLFSSEQLRKLVLADKEGREVELQLIRGGKQFKKSVTIGKYTPAAQVARARWTGAADPVWAWAPRVELRGNDKPAFVFTPPPGPTPFVLPKVVPPAKSAPKVGVPNKSLNVQRLKTFQSRNSKDGAEIHNISVSTDGKTAKVSVTYTDKTNKKVEKKYEGTNAEVLEKIKELPVETQENVRRVLNIPKSDWLLRLEVRPLWETKPQFMLFVDGFDPSAERVYRNIIRLDEPPHVDLDVVINRLESENVPETIRARVRDTLKRVRPPQVRVQVDEPL